MTEVRKLRYHYIASRPVALAFDPHSHMSAYKCPDCGSENEQSAKFCGSCGRDLFARSAGAGLIGSTIVEKYIIRRVIAAGGMGVVYEADQTFAEYHRTVAVKMLRPELSQDQIVVSRFNRECGIVAQLTHQNIVRLFDYGATDDGTLYIAMEYVRGKSLAAIIADGALPVERALHVIEQMCHGLHEAHELGIVHRDLKPDNVILTQLGSDTDFVKLLDFGIAIRLSAGGQHETKLTQQGIILGTPPYMSPEQFTGSAVTRQSDIYSLGIILYEALTGQLPFTADNPWLWAQRHLTSIPPELPNAFPPAVVATVRAALAKDPALRPRTALEMYQMLRGTSGVEAQQPVVPSDACGSSARTPPSTQPDVPGIAATEPPGRTAPTERTDPAGAPIMTNGTPVFSNVLPLQHYEPQVKPELGYYVPPTAELPRAPTKTTRRSTRLGVVVASLLVVGLGGLALAYWFDWIDLPFQQSATANSWPTSTTHGLSAAPGEVTTVLPQAGVELAPVAQAPVLAQTPAENRNHPAKIPSSNSSAKPQPNPSSVPPSSTASPTPSSSAAPGGLTWPPIISGLPTSLPPLPSSIAGIPIPPIFGNQQANPAPAPSGGPSP